MALGDTVRHGISYRGRCLPQSICLKQDAIHVASGGVVDLRRRVCDSHWVEYFRLRNSPRRTALHVSLSVAVGAFSLAAAANIHALRTGTGNQRLLGLALLIWPIMSGVPAFMAALTIAAGLARMRPHVTKDSGQLRG